MKRVMRSDRAALAKSAAPSLVRGGTRRVLHRPGAGNLETGARHATSVSHDGVDRSHPVMPVTHP